MNNYNLIKSYYSRLECACANNGWSNPVKTMLAMNLKEEKEHRGTRSDFPKEFTANLAAKYFTLRHVFEGLTPSLKVADILHTRLSCFYGEGVAAEFGEEISGEFSSAEIEEFMKLDYAKMME